MAELTIFSYYAQNSILHRRDVRFKFLYLFLISIAVVKAQTFALLIILTFMTILIRHIRIPLFSVIRDLRYFSLILIFIFIARSLSTPGKPVFRLFFITITDTGIYDGIRVCLQLIVMVLTGLLLTATTRTSEIRAAIIWFLAPFPFVPRERIATMISLIVRFMPVIVNCAKELSDAQNARLIENIKNPIYRTIKFAIPLMRRIFDSANHLIVAMEARCYSENRTYPELLANKGDWIGLLIACSFHFLVFSIAQ